MIRILGIDPGSRMTGYGVIDSDGRDSTHVACGTIRVEGDSLPEKLGMIFHEVSAVIKTWQPEQIAIEDIFMSRSAGSALKLGQARGAAICAGVVSNLPVAEYSAREVKQAVVGTGGADKEQVQHMVRLLLKLSETPQADAADALAVALSHAHTESVAAKIPAMIKGLRR
ncbi:MAG TPA: crossover junction endodeoxyribonuclease RuvC [Chromatiales bacterium]|nr:crossover junction endodeoxyribonuclease RuvC [Thiotrichales bacterium]HIP68033.1 crossover junction endodeoxyribonuclease RuvC [Chromatiales bacterium]